MPGKKQFDVDAGLNKALKEFWSNGFEATSMQDLVTCMGINRARLYATYGDKRTLFLATLTQYSQKQGRSALARLEDTYPPAEAIRQLFVEFARLSYDGEPAEGCFLTNSALELAAHDKQVRAIVSNSQNLIQAFFAKMIVKGQVLGEIPAELDIEECASGLLATLQGLIVLTRSRPERKLLNLIIEDAMKRLR